MIFKRALLKTVADKENSFPDSDSYISLIINKQKHYLFEKNHPVVSVKIATFRFIQHKT